jgi:predicted O-methyltransferase YrrM
MYSLFKYLSYKATAKHKKGYGIHSPFLFNIITTVFNDKHEYNDYIRIEERINQIKASHDKINKLDLGKGSKHQKSNHVLISDLIKHSSVSKKYGRLLYRLARYVNPKNTIELGTSLGVSTCYLALGSRNNIIYSIEGCPECFSLALNNFTSLNLKNIHPVNGNFNNELPEILNKIQRVDMVYIDGDHRKEKTLDYFNQCIQASHNDTMIIIDDIHWSKEMSEAWKCIYEHPLVTLSLDVYRMGIVFLKTELSKQHFVIRY